MVLVLVPVVRYHIIIIIIITISSHFAVECTGRARQHVYEYEATRFIQMDSLILKIAGKVRNYVFLLGVVAALVLVSLSTSRTSPETNVLSSCRTVQKLRRDIPAKAFHGESSPYTSCSSTSSSTTPYQKFIVVTSQRSGSGWLSSLLNNHTGIICGHELLLHEKSLYKSNNSAKAYADGIDRILDTFYKQQIKKIQKDTSCPPALVGFKIMHGQGFLHHGLSLMEEWAYRRYKIIHLIRRNKLLQYFSALEMNIGFKTRDGEIAHPETADQVNKLVSVKVNPTASETIPSLKKRFAESAEASGYLASVGDVTTVYYEDLLEDTQAEMDRLFRFLRVSPQAVSSSFLQIHSEPRIRDFYVEDNKLRESYRKQMSQSEYAYLMDGW